MHCYLTPAAKTELPDPRRERAHKHQSEFKPVPPHAPQRKQNSPISATEGQQQYLYNLIV